MLASLSGESAVEGDEDSSSFNVGGWAAADTASVSLEISKNEARSSEGWLNDDSRICVGSDINVSTKNVERLSKLLWNIVESRSPKTSKSSENSG